MRIITSRSYGENANLIQIDSAVSDDGRIEYAPIGNDRLQIDGRDAYRGRYMDGGEVEAGLWERACSLMQEVDNANRAAEDAARRIRDERECQRLERLSESMRGTRGTYLDEGTF